MSDAHAYMMSQATKGTSFSINEETFAFTIESLVDNLATQEHVLGDRPSADKDFALRNLQAK
eukprot:121134-Pyramimonas_sp.AAC.1